MLSLLAVAGVACGSNSSAESTPSVTTTLPTVASTVSPSGTLSQEVCTEVAKLRSDLDDLKNINILQSGTDAGQSGGHVVSLGSVAYVPLWVFHRGDPIGDVRELKGRRIAVGAPESGTRALAVTLLAANGADKPPTELLPGEREAAVEQLKKGELDAVFLVAPAEAPFIQKLTAVPGIHLLSFDRADAYVRRFPYLTKFVLPHGVFDLAADVPSSDVTLLSPTASLVARDTLHPALAYLLLRTATEVHS